MARYILPFVDRFPPMLCRLLARKNRGKSPMSTREIARVSGLPKSTVDKIGRFKSWRDVPCGVMMQFSLACGINFLDGRCLSRQRASWLNERAIYLSNASPAQKKMFDRILNDLSGRANSGSAVRV